MDDPKQKRHSAMASSIQFKTEKKMEQKTKPMNLVVYCQDSRDADFIREFIELYKRQKRNKDDIKCRRLQETYESVFAGSVNLNVVTRVLARVIKEVIEFQKDWVVVYEALIYMNMLHSKNKQLFSNEMERMFPESPCKCSYEAWRKQGCTDKKVKLQLVIDALRLHESDWRIE